MEVGGTPEERVKHYVEFTNQNDESWMTNIGPHVSFISASLDGPHPTATFGFTVQTHHGNGSPNMHGGAIATLFDWATSMPLALVCKPGYWSMLGVTRTLNVTYLRPAPIGTETVVEAELIHAGKSLALIRGVMRRKKDGAVLATCEHNKANVDPPVESESKL